ncbi:NADH-ubiquinone oxidoreductase 14.8 kDa subunit [Psilocybe cubensis]|uniref:NADH-ubiquinone oxidoreductase 14.8 kDa subunit n=2 Tax=Psilocybe cubensis TaxID=181762 RepID=A0ACB8GMK5_PSICU|nr:NADH-ubiquinone oxidoreductase 14.8 kDa subunit [Psilocybe cubensis]KAH9476888.1 NADH-ubiquinone oxidoreductase 14.8 kDa subunit [Psilocybe cubensis]
MTTIPARLASLTRTSSGPAESRKRALKLYRDWYRSAPEICGIYALSVSPAYVRHAIRQRFEKNRNVTDQRAIDVLLLKSRQDYQETMNCWKQIDHVMGITLNSQERPKKTFLEKFYEGKDEQAVIPAASGI